MAASSLENQHFMEPRTEVPREAIKLPEAKRSLVTKSRMAVAMIGLGLSGASAWSVDKISGMNEANTMAAEVIERGYLKPGELDEIEGKLIPGVTDMPLAKRRYLETLPTQDGHKVASSNLGRSTPASWEAEWENMK